MKTPNKFAVCLAMASLSSLSCLQAEEATRPVASCTLEIASLRAEIEKRPSSLLELVESAVRTYPSCSCEVVKASIEAGKANPETVAAIVEAAGITSPENLRLIAQCAVAVAPDALDEVQAVLAKLDPSTGESGLSGKEVAEKGGIAPNSGDDTGNPLDFPSMGQKPSVGPDLGQNPMSAYVPFFFPYQPPFVDSNPATNNDLN